MGVYGIGEGRATRATGKRKRGTEEKKRGEESREKGRSHHRETTCVSDVYVMREC